MAEPFIPPDETLPPLESLLPDEISFQDVKDLAGEEGWTYDEDVDQFFDRNGEPVTLQQIRALIDEEVDAADTVITEYTESVFDGESSLSEWEENVAEVLIGLALILFLLGFGGQREKITFRDIDYIERRIQEQLGYLRRFSRDILSGQKSREHIRARVRLYTRDDSLAFEQAWDRLHDDRMFPWYRNVLGGCEHCQLCPQESARGWVRRGALIPIGSRDCRVNCCCHYEYSNSRERPQTDTLLKQNYGWLGNGLVVSL